MAFCLMACFNQVVRHDGIQVFSRLGGKYLGNIDMCNTTLSAFQKVRFLQQQASSLCPHPKRTCEDLLLYVGQEQVGPPGMAYMDDLDEEASLKVHQLLKGCTRLEMMWDEDDAYAKSKVEQAGIQVSAYDNTLVVALTCADLPKECGYLGKQGKSQWRINSLTGTNICVDFSVFKMRYAISASGSMYPLEVNALSLANITPTNYMHCNVKNLSVVNSEIDCKVFANLDQLEDLCLHEFCNTPSSHEVRNFEELAKLPKLKSLYLGYNLCTRWMTPKSLSELFDAMKLMPHVKVAEDNYHESLPLRDVPVNLPIMQLGSPQRMCATHHLPTTYLGCIARGLALAVGLTALRLGWPYLKARFS